MAIMGLLLSFSIVLVAVFAVGAVLVGTVFYFIGKLIYLAFFHPLARYPGPFLAKFTDGYSAYHVWLGDLHIDMWRCHEDYGEFVRYGPNKLLVNSTAGIADIYGNNKNTTKSAAYSVMVHRAPNSLTMTDKKEHGRRRRILSYGFSDAALRRYEVAILTRVNQLCEQLNNAALYNSSSDESDKPTERRWSSSQNMAAWFNYLTFDIMAEVVFGEKFDLLTKPDERYVIDSIEMSNRRTSVLIQMPSFRFLRLDKKFFPAAIAARNSFLKFTNRLIKVRIPAGRKSPPDVITCLLDAKDPITGEGLSVPEILAESVTMIVAGSDTSSTAMASSIFYLCRFPEAYQKVTAEVRSTFKNADEICLGTKLTSCTYLRACIDEAMRMTPPVGGAPYRQVGPGGCVVNDKFFPAGVDIGTAIYSMHHQEKYFPNAFTYQPERWINKDENLMDLSAFTPFSVGPRGCTGKGLAMAELTLTIANLLMRFDFRTADGELGLVGEGDANGKYGTHRVREFQVKDHITAQKEGPFVKFMPHEQGNEQAMVHLLD